MSRVVVDATKCEGERECLRVCPTGVFALRRPTNPLPLLLRVKVTLHGGKQAFARNEGACTACLKCVDACPEAAITVSSDFELVQ